MAISIDYIRPWTQADATAGQTVFSTIWTADAASDILVYARADGVEARDVDQLVLPIDYTVQFIGAGLTVQVTFLAGRTVDDVITITRDTPADKMNLYSNTNFKPSMLNSDFERIVMMIQTNDLYDKDLAPRYNTSETPYGVDENNPPNFNRIIDLYLPLLPPLHVWRKNAANTMIEAVLFAGGGGISPGGPITVPQPTDGLAEGDWVRWDMITGMYIPAMADNTVNAEVSGCVASITDADNFVLQQNGPNEVTFAAFNEGIYFLSTTVPGGMTLSLPQNSGEINIAVLDKTNGPLAMVMNKRGKVVGTQDPGPGTGENELIVTQPGNDFQVKEAVRADPNVPGAFLRALADTFSNAQVVGIVTEIIDPGNTFRLQSHGYTSAFGGVNEAELWWLSDTNPGEISVVKPTNSTSFTKPMFVVSTSGAGFILEDRQLQVPVEEATVITIPQDNHGFVVKDFVRTTGVDDTYTKGLADAIENARTSGMVIDASDPDEFTLQTSGFVQGLTGIAPQQHYWLSSTLAGKMDAVEPTADGEISKPVFRGASTTAGYILEQRPMIQPQANGGSGGGDGVWRLLETQTVAGVTSIDFPTVISENPLLTEFDVRFVDLYAAASSQPLNIQYYIGGVLQVSGYQSQQKSSLPAAPSLGSTTISARMTDNNVGVGSSLLLATSGRLKIYAPSTNGTHKLAEGVTLFAHVNAGALTDRVVTMAKMISNTAPLEGVNINAGVVLLTGTVSIYAR